MSSHSPSPRPAYFTGRLGTYPGSNFRTYESLVSEKLPLSKFFVSKKYSCYSIHYHSLPLPYLVSEKYKRNHSFSRNNIFNIYNTVCRSFQEGLKVKNNSCNFFSFPFLSFLFFCVRAKLRTRGRRKRTPGMIGLRPLVEQENLESARSWVRVQHVSVWTTCSRRHGCTGKRVRRFCVCLHKISAPPHSEIGVYIYL